MAGDTVPYGRLDRANAKNELMKRTLLPLLLFFVVRVAAQQPAYFIDGYHGGIYGHLPSWQTKFMVDKLTQYPDWKINLELEPESWDTISVHDPGAYAAFKKIMEDQGASGRVEYLNPCYGQSYLYNISGESVIRQLEYGIRKLRQHFPTVVCSTYSSEEPCFTSALPGVLRSFGFTYASLKNPNTCWGGYTRAYGGELVNWIGPDGSSILTSPRYEIEALKPGSTWETIASTNSSTYVQHAFDYGIKHPVGMCLQDAGWDAGPWLKGSFYKPTIYETWRGYFERVTSGKADKDWPFSQEDIQVGLMWGAQVLQRIARSVRASENNIVRAEKLAAMAGMWKGANWPGQAFDAAWRTLLLSQHHDCWIVPYNGKNGDTWIDKVVRWTGNTDGISDSVMRSAARELAGGAGGYVRVFNTTAVQRDELVAFNGRLFRARVPAMGYASYKLDALPVVKGASAVRLDNGIWRIETDLYIIQIDPSKGGAVTSWVAKKLGGREFVPVGQRFNELRGNFYNAGGFKSSSDTAADVQVVENGPAEVKVRVKGIIAGSPFTQVLTVQAGQPRVDVNMKIDWIGNPAIGEYFDVPKKEDVRKAYYDDRFKLLALFPLNLTGQKVYKNAPFDVTESRLTNTFYNRWDSIKNNVLLNWVDVVDGAGNYGMALFCDHTTSYAHGEDFPLGLTIQYSGNGIFYRNYGIDGPTEINYALMPHAGKWDKAGIWTEGTKWSEPLVVVEAAKGGGRSLLQVTRGVEVSSLTMSGGTLQVRLFNAEGASGVKRLDMGFNARAVKIVELDGREVKELPVHRDKGGRCWVELSIPRYGIRTLKFEHV